MERTRLELIPFLTGAIAMQPAALTLFRLTVFCCNYFSVFEGESEQLGWLSSWWRSCELAV